MVVVLRHEALDHRQVVGEVERLILEVDVRRLRHEGGRAVVGAGEFHLALADEQHHLPVQDAGGGALAHPHRDAGGGEVRENLIVAGIAGVRGRVHQHAHRHARLPAPDDLRLVACVLHEPERHVDADVFVLDEPDERGAAVLVRCVAEPFVRTLRRRLCLHTWRKQRNADRRDRHSRHPAKQSSFNHEPHVLLRHPRR